MQLSVAEKTQNVRRLEAQRNELNAKGEGVINSIYIILYVNYQHRCIVRLLHEELQLLQEQGSHVGEVIKPMDKKKVLVKVRMLSLTHTQITTL